MSHNISFEVSICMGLAFAASLISASIGILVALFEILVEIIAGNSLRTHQSVSWIDYLVLYNADLLSFLADAEIDIQWRQANMKAYLTTGLLSTALLFISVRMLNQNVFGWELK